MTRHIGKSACALLATIAIGSLIHFDTTSSVAHATFHLDLPIAPLARLADSLHDVTLQLDEKITELAALDSAIAHRCDLPVVSTAMQEMAASTQMLPALPDINRDAFILTSRISRQQAYIAELSTAVQKRISIADNLPTLIPCNGVHTSGFGMRVHPVRGGERQHTGMDIAASTGTPIHASGDGVVVFAGVKSGYGNVVEIDHGYGYHTLYGHSSKLLVKAGEEIHRGDKIALVGSTGVSTGSHLHYEVIVDGEKVDPDHFLMEPLAAPAPQNIPVMIAKR